MPAFAVALSFAGQHRDRVLPVAEGLGEVYGRESVFYDEWADFAHLRGGQVLLEPYQRAKLMVVFLSPEYGQRSVDERWTRREWDVAYERNSSIDTALVLGRLVSLEP